MTGLRWVTVPQEWPGTNKYLHLVPKGGDTSLCSTTALPASLWRARPANSNKPKCPECLERQEAYETSSRKL